MPDHQEIADDVKVFRRIPGLQPVAHGLQDRSWIIIFEDLGLSELRDGEVGEEETEQSCPEQHCFGHAVAGGEDTEEAGMGGRGS